MTNASGALRDGEAAGAVGYAGDMTATEAWEFLSRNPDAVLVDVRSAPEWQFVGIPELGAIGKAPVFVSWQTWPGMKPHADFLAELRAAVPSASAPLLFLCRSGARSKAAALAATAGGFRHCYNVSGGFEGGANDRRQRGAVDGWKAHGLPWSQE